MSAVVVELRRMARKMRAFAKVCKGLRENTNWSDTARFTGAIREVQSNEDAAMLETRIKEIEAAECAAHPKPRRYYMVTRCKRCRAVIEQEVPAVGKKKKKREVRAR